MAKQPSKLSLSQTFICSLCVCFSLMYSVQSAQAKNHNRDSSFSTSDDILSNPLTVEDLKQRLEVIGEVYFFDSSGKKLIAQLPQWRKWRSRRGDAPIESNWSMSSNQYETLALHHVWSIREDGSIGVLIEQYDSMQPLPGEGGKVEYGKLLKKENFVLTDFAPIKWVSENEKKHRMVVILTPHLREDETPKPLSEIPLSGEELTLTDSKGNVWTEHVSVHGKYVGIITHRGAILLSFYPFKGSQPLGTAKENRIELRLSEDNSLNVTSQSAFLPPGVPTTVYAQYRPDLKTAHFGSTKVNTSDKEIEFLEKIEN